MYTLFTKKIIDESKPGLDIIPIGFPIVFDQLLSMSTSASQKVAGVTSENSKKDHLVVEARSYTLTLRTGVTTEMTSVMDKNVMVMEGRALLVRELLEIVRIGGFYVTGDKLPAKCALKSYSFQEDAKRGTEINLSLEEVLLGDWTRGSATFQIALIAKITELTAKAALIAREGLGGGLV